MNSKGEKLFDAIMPYFGLSMIPIVLFIIIFGMFNMYDSFFVCHDKSVLPGQSCPSNTTIVKQDSILMCKCK